MRVARVIGLLFATAASWLVCGCIPVDDLGGYWDKGRVDPQLQGYWKHTGPTPPADLGHIYVSFQREADHYITETLMTSTPANAPRTTYEVKTLALGNHKFLMSRHVDTRPELAALMVGHPKGLQRYTVSDDVLTVYYLDESVLHDAITQGKVAGRLPPTDLSMESVDSMDPQQVAYMVPAILKLDDQSIAFVRSVADQPAYWKRVERFRRVGHIEKEMRTARAYRATRKTAGNASVTVNLPDLKYFSEGKTNVLLRQLEASPEWMVTRDGSDLVAFRREFEHGAWQVDPYSGFQWHADQGLLTRCMFRFADRAAGQFADAFNRPLLKIVGPVAGKVHLSLAASNHQGIQSYLAAGQRGLWFEFYEQTRQESRVRTREALKYIAGLLRKVRQSEAEVRRLGFAPSLMPPESYTRGEPRLEVSGAEPAGSYDVVAWANPGKEGYVRLRMFDVGDGAELTPPLTFIGPSEFMGWSDELKTLFRHDSMVALHGKDGGRHFQARIELWFHPSDGAPEVKLVETTYPVDAPPRPEPAVMR